MIKINTIHIGGDKDKFLRAGKKLKELGYSVDLEKWKTSFSETFNYITLDGDDIRATSHLLDGTGISVSTLEKIHFSKDIESETREVDEMAVCKKEQESTFIKYPKIGGMYRHYKGGLYKVITLCNHTETGERLVIYKSIHFRSMHARPLTQWFEEVINHEGRKTARFKEE